MSQGRSQAKARLAAPTGLLCSKPTQPFPTTQAERVWCGASERENGVCRLKHKQMQCQVRKCRENTANYRCHRVCFFFFFLFFPFFSFHLARPVENTDELRNDDEQEETTTGQEQRQKRVRCQPQQQQTNKQKKNQWWSSSSSIAQRRFRDVEEEDRLLTCRSRDRRTRASSMWCRWSLR